jgi:hypothetical protein
MVLVLEDFGGDLFMDNNNNRHCMGVPEMAIWNSSAK